MEIFSKIFSEILKTATTKDLILFIMFIGTVGFIVIAFVINAIWYFIKTAISKGVEEGIKKANSTNSQNDKTL